MISAIVSAFLSIIASWLANILFQRRPTEIRESHGSKRAKHIGRYHYRPSGRVPLIPFAKGNISG